MDQRQISPGTVISSCLEYCDAIILEGARLARLGLWEGKNYKFGLFEQAQDLAPFCGSLSAEQEESIKDIKRYIVESRFLR